MRDNASYAIESVKKKLNDIGDVILVGSGKGGVGKSMVACAIAITLSREGHRVGLFDIDVHGPSVPSYLGLRPPLRSSEKGLEPMKLGRLRTMSIAFFSGDNPVPVRGGEKEGLLTQLMALTNWGELDYLIVDLPPGMGDELFSAFTMFSNKCRLLLVTTPSRHASTIVSLMCKLAQRERVPLAGVAVNMSYMMNRGRRIHPLGKADRVHMEKTMGVKIVTEIPLEPRINERRFSLFMKEENEFTEAIRNLTRKLSSA
jgi:ATP-binding protein involved in chromosome partitioning